eukprot:CAMPEP_0117548244 /NCGR_PEP_ID=MMETSP0784-20121206/47552_1 /TAXON_ID=39447 /ORGANISM="" /LENGTH=287 /DNA_ID=CAMNT_0005345199 /DNA_START=35 /DNA_END=895 /DNA_ORIENTATION=+
MPTPFPFTPLDPHDFLNRSALQERIELPKVDGMGPEKSEGAELPYFAGGDVMYQLLYRKLGGDVTDWPKISGRTPWRVLQAAGSQQVPRRAMHKAPVPLNASEDELALMAQASAAAKRAITAATYARSSADKANEFLRFGVQKAKDILRDPPIRVTPTADVFPLYSSAFVAEAFLVCVAAVSATASQRGRSILRTSRKALKTPLGVSFDDALGIIRAGYSEASLQQSTRRSNLACASGAERSKPYATSQLWPRRRAVLASNLGAKCARYRETSWRPRRREGKGAHVT